MKGFCTPRESDYQDSLYESRRREVRGVGQEQVFQLFVIKDEPNKGLTGLGTDRAGRMVRQSRNVWLSVSKVLPWTIGLRLNNANKYMWHIQFYTTKWNTSQPHHYMFSSISRCTPRFPPYLVHICIICGTHFSMGSSRLHALSIQQNFTKPCPTLDFHFDVAEASWELQLRKCLSFLTKFYLYFFTKFTKVNVWTLSHCDQSHLSKSLRNCLVTS